MAGTSALVAPYPPFRGPTPAALRVAGDDLGARTVLRLLERWPTQEQLAGATREELVEFARAAHHGRPERFADQVAGALAGSHFLARPALIGAKADSIRLAARQLLLIAEQRKLWGWASPPSASRSTFAEMAVTLRLRWPCSEAAAYARSRAGPH